MRLASQIFFEILARNQNSISKSKGSKMAKNSKITFFFNKKEDPLEKRV